MEATSPANSFLTVEEMAEYQADQEVQEALRVQAMNGDERWKWLTNTWGRLQAEASLLYADMPPRPHTTRCFATFEEKNAFDEQRELEFAMQLHAKRGMK